MRILDIQHAPGEGPSEDGIEPASHCHRKAQCLVFSRIGAAFRKMRDFRSPHSLIRSFLFPVSISCVMRLAPNFTSAKGEKRCAARGVQRGPTSNIVESPLW